MKTRVILLATLTLTIFLSATATKSYADDFLLQGDVKVVAPDKSTPGNLAAFSGKWDGDWYGDRTRTYLSDQLLIVEKINEGVATVVYSWIPRWGNFTPGWIRIDAKFSDDGALVITFPSGSVATYKMYKRGNLAATMQSPQGGWSGTLKKID